MVLKDENALLNARLEYMVASVVDFVNEVKKRVRAQEQEQVRSCGIGNNSESLATKFNSEVITCDTAQCFVWRSAKCSEPPSPPPCVFEKIVLRGSRCRSFEVMF